MLEKEAEGNLLINLFYWLEARQDEKYAVYREFMVVGTSNLISIKEAIGLMKHTQKKMTQNYNSLKEYFKTGSFPKPSDEKNLDSIMAKFREFGMKGYF